MRWLFESLTALGGYIKVNDILENSESYIATCHQQKQVPPKVYHSQFVQFCRYRLHSKWTVVGNAVYTQLSLRKHEQKIEQTLK